MSDIRSRGSVGQNMLSRRGQIRGFEGDGEAAPSQADHVRTKCDIRILYVHGQCLLPSPFRRLQQSATRNAHRIWIANKEVFCMAKEVEKRSGKATRQRYKKDRRETVIQVRMNAEELALLDGKRGGRTRSNYLRGALYGSAGSHTEHEVVADTPQLDRMLMELNRIGVNINQIARVFNARVKGMGMLEEIKMKPDKKAFESLRESIEGLSDEVKELRADLHGGITGGDV